MDIIEKAKKNFPDLNIKIINKVDSEELIELLEMHKIDFIIGTNINNTSLNKNIHFETIKEVKNILVSNKPLTITKISDLKKLNYILSLDYTYSTKTFESCLEEHGIKIKPSIELHTTELKIDAAKRGLGVAHVIKDAVKKELENRELYEVEIPIEIPTSHIDLLYIEGQLGKVSRNFIREYLR